MSSRGIMQHLENKECAENYPRTVCNCLLAYFTNLRRKMLINANPKSAEVPTGHRQRIATPSTIYILHRLTQRCCATTPRLCKDLNLVQTHKCSLLIIGLHIFEIKLC